MATNAVKEVKRRVSQPEVMPSRLYPQKFRLLTLFTMGNIAVRNLAWFAGDQITVERYLPPHCGDIVLVSDHPSASGKRYSLLKYVGSVGKEHPGRCYLDCGTSDSRRKFSLKKRGLELIGVVVEWRRRQEAPAASKAQTSGGAR